MEKKKKKWKITNVGVNISIPGREWVGRKKKERKIFLLSHSALLVVV